eukprot:scaffold1039_cov101-Cylindrotheca_fusiformis.AAC.3
MMNKIAISCLLLVCLHMISVEARNLPSSTYSDYSSPDTYSTYSSSDSSGKGKGKGSKKSTSISSSRRSRLSKSGKGKGGKGSSRGSKRDSSITRPTGNTRPTGTTRKSAGGGPPTGAPTPSGGGPPTGAPTPGGGGSTDAPTIAEANPALIPNEKDFDRFGEDDDILIFGGLIWNELRASRTSLPPTTKRRAVPNEQLTSIESADGSTTFTLESVSIAGLPNASPVEITGFDANGDETLFRAFSFTQQFQTFDLSEFANVQKLQFFWQAAGENSAMDNFVFTL